MYIQREPIGSLAQNRVWSILTIENLAGLLIGAAVMIGLQNVLGISAESFSALWFFNLAMIAVGAGIGIALTMRWTGLSMLDRIFLWFGYRLRKLTGDDQIIPAASGSHWAGARAPMTITSDDGTILAAPVDTDWPR